jgi:histidine triad (HIT) family protein
LHPNEVLGLLASINIQTAPGLLPNVVYETDRTIVIKHPFPSAKYHVLIIPKRDIKNIGEFRDEDADYILDALKVSAILIQKEKLKTYRLWTNGPNNQIVAYLHWHLTGM